MDLTIFYAYYRGFRVCHAVFFCTRATHGRSDAVAVEKRLIVKVYVRLKNMIYAGRSKADAMLVKGPGWPIGRSQLAHVVGYLTGTGERSVGAYWQEALENRCTLRDPRPHGPKRLKAAEVQAEEPDVYAELLSRISDVHASGRVNTVKKLHYFLSGDEAGPKLPDLGPRRVRALLRRLGFAYDGVRKLIVSDRAKPYIIKWRKAYCARRVGALDSLSGPPPVAGLTPRS